jgi:deazaflavin-dependent oxidoreductase (nitroreductase family)
MNTAAASPAPASIPLSIRALRRLQPLVLGLLRSPLHPLLSRDVLILTWKGRRSGLRRTLPLSYVRLGRSLVLCTRPEGSVWWKNLRGGAEVEVRLAGHRVRATATVLDPASREALEGLRAFVTRNPRTGAMLYHVRPGPHEEDLAREVVDSVVVRLDLAP